jgi:drug/metabolite transporter (DMT)-like permease
MDATYVAAALLSALLHASWNAAVKAAPDPARAMTAQMVLSAIIVLPGLLWSGLPDRASWIWIAASTLMNVLTVGALLRAYALGGFGIVYPIARAVAVLLVVPMAAAFAGERLGLSALCGILIMSAALGALAWDAARDRVVSMEALAWTLAAGVGTAAYIMCDAQGVRAAGSPFAYGFAVSITNAIAMSWRRRGAGTPWRQIEGYWGVGLATAAAAVVSYLLILWVWSSAPIAPASALRDTSAVYAVLIAVLWLKEPFTRTRIAAALLAAAAVPLLRLG